MRELPSIQSLGRSWALLLLAGLICSSCSSVLKPEPAQDQSSACQESEYGAGFERIGLLESVDGGYSWHFLGHACFHSPQMLPVDPSPLAKDGDIVLYFLDLVSLNPSRNQPTIYRAESREGLDFSPPRPVITFQEPTTDPYLLKLREGGYLMFLGRQGEAGGIISVSSIDGIGFSPTSPAKVADGGTPGALSLPDSRVRLFVAGPEGITSLISLDGLHFEKEPGLRIPSSGIRVTDPHPIQLSSGGYLMVYTLHPEGDFPSERDRLASLEIHLARSEDGLNWEPVLEPIGIGGVPGMVETADGRLLVYYVDVEY